MRRASSAAVLVRTAAIALGAASITPFSPAHAQRVLTVLASDTALSASPTVPAGITTLRLQLTGKTRRDLTLHRIPAGTMPEVVAKGAAGRPDSWFQQWSFGGPSTPHDSAPDAMATVDLRPGRYALVSYVVDSAGRPRPDRYAWRDVTVIAAAILIPARFPVPDATIKVKDARMDETGVLKTGQRTLQFENVGARPHDVLIGRLKPGKTVDDVIRWDRDGKEPPPFVYVGGLTPMSTSTIAQTRVVLQAGTHVVFSTVRHVGQRDRDYTRGVLTTFKVT